MNNDDKILKTLDQHGQILTALMGKVVTVLEIQQEQGKDIKAVKEVVKFVDMKVEAGNAKSDKNTAELKEELEKKADKADIMNLGAKIDKVTKDHETRIKELEADQGIHHRNKN